jgi:sugar/nucleoside kinase (ribokinase family)
MAQFDLLVIGEINPDLILRGEDVTPAFGQAEKLVEDATLTIGSSSAITACGAARLGLRVTFLGVVGDDPFGHFMLEALAARGVDTSACLIDPSLSTGLSVILARPDDRAILTHLGTMPALHPEQVDPALLRRARHLHVGSYFLLYNLQPGLPGLFAEARAAGATTSVDTNWDPAGRWDGSLERLWPHCDLFLPNAAEARKIAGSSDLDSALALLAGKIGVVAVKLGAEGALARQGESVVRYPGYPAEVVDTVGAGDSFNAGFLYATLHGWPLEMRLRLANACGALSTRAAGGTAAQPTLAEALALAGLEKNLTGFENLSGLEETR